VRRLFAAAVVVWAFAATTIAQRTPDGHPDLQGFWTNSTATPLERPEAFADKAVFTPEEADEFERSSLPRLLKNFPDDQIKTAGDLNETYLETQGMKVVPDRRTSLIVDPANGKLPARVHPAPKPAPDAAEPVHDGPESFDLDERCLLETAFGSSNAAPPMVPNPFGQNFYQIVQTPDYVMILTEIVHDARIIRIGGTHLPPSERQWLGDSVGRWEGDTLVVDTTNYTAKSTFRGSGTGLHVVERFQRVSPTTIDYRATVEDADTWVAPWTVSIPFRATDQPPLEYACHEANYSLEFSLRGARAEETAPVQ
jgi:hypothetical protein